MNENKASGRISVADVEAAILENNLNIDNVTSSSIRELLGRGSFSTIKSHIDSIKIKNSQSHNDSFEIERLRYEKIIMDLKLKNRSLRFELKSEIKRIKISNKLRILNLKVKLDRMRIDSDSY